jgi:colanic acid/amylovoran biosynthesis glycosyltransferase
MPRYHLAYVFERFPTFTQTFCVREVVELERQGLRPLIFSIRDTRDEQPQHFEPALLERVIFLPPEKELVEIVNQLKDQNLLPQQIVLSLRHWGERSDKMRVYEAAWIGHRMQQEGVAHAHSHFAGIGARVGWWLKFAYDFTYSFTGHANDLFCASGVDIDLTRLMKDASLIVTVSDYTVRELKKNHPFAQSKIKRVYNGLEIGKFHGELQPETPPLLLSVGRLIEKKGFDDLVRACGILREKNLRFRCEIIGEGPDEEALRTQIEEAGLTDYVQLAGPQPQDAIIRRLHATSVFVLACVTEKDGGKDNLPTVLMEAMAARLPCVSTRVAGVPEMVEDGVTGAVVDERRPADLAEKIAELLHDASRAQQMGVAGYARAQQHFAQQRTVAGLKKYLISRGLVRWDAALVGAHLGAYASQGLRRALRLLRFRRWRHRRSPDFLRAQP